MPNIFSRRGSLAKKAYTVLIISQKASKVKKFIFSPLTIKIGVVALGVAIAIIAFIIYDYAIYKKKVFELEELRAKTQSQHAEIRSFLEKITILEEQLNRLKEMEKQMAVDLKEVNELKKTKSGNPTLHPKKTSTLVPEWENKEKEMSPLPTQEVTILEGQRSPLVSSLCRDIFALCKRAFHQEQNLTELREFLLAKKSVLQSIPSLWPVFGHISSRFGDTRLSPSSGGIRPHVGVDISSPQGTPILAPADGKVSFAGRVSEYGRLVCLNHGHGFATLYGHLEELKVQTGERVYKGQIIGTVGNTGKSTGPHLHYEVHVQGIPRNPVHYLTETQ